jgi:gluconate 2-dehydrogenase gamma chain
MSKYFPSNAGPADPSRRRLFKAAGATGIAVAIPVAKVTDAAGQPAPRPMQQRQQRPQHVYTFLNPDEAAFVQAAVARLIPNDETGPGALEAGVPAYIDAQLAGAWGAGERLYRSGPWGRGTPSQGYQLPFTPAELFRHAIRGVHDEVTKTKGAPFAKLPPQDQDAYLDALQKGKHDVGGVPANVFFESLLEVTIEGFFSDPVYGGNRDMVAWRMIGFPGAYANYYALVDRHNLALERLPTSLAQTGEGEIHVHPDIPAGLAKTER